MYRNNIVDYWHNISTAAPSRGRYGKAAKNSQIRGSKKKKSFGSHMDAILAIFQKHMRVKQTFFVASLKTQGSLKPKDSSASKLATFEFVKTNN